MTRFGIHTLRVGLLAVLLSLAGREVHAAEAAEPADFKEAFDIIRSHLNGISDAELDRAAVRGLVSALGPKVSLVTSEGAAKRLELTPTSKSSVYDGDIAYVRLGRVDDGLPKALRDACRQLGATNRLKGLVLDLRYADGEDYAASVAAADLFVKQERPLLNWGNGVVRSKQKDDAIALPVAVLVNSETAAGAEALAAMLRETTVGLILGGRTAGRATIAQEFPLKNGDRLRIATGPVLLGDGTALSSQGLKPDIAVDVSAEEERAYFADAFRMNTRSSDLSSTNRAPRLRRFNEAELVRERREGPVTNADLTARDTDIEKPAVRDPVLARGIDLLKGLAVVRQSRP
jgi:hypothetical protein